MITFVPAAQFSKQASVLLITYDQVRQKKFSFGDKEVAAQIALAASAGQFSGEEGELFPLVLRKKVLVLAGVGKKDKVSLTGLRKTVRSALQSPFLSKTKSVELVPYQDTEDIVAAVIEGVLIGTYAWQKYKTKESNDKAVDKKEVYLVATKKKSYGDIIATCEGLTLTRDLINDNADTVTATYVEQVIKKLVKGKKSFSLEVLNAKELKAKGLNLHFAVNQGSKKEPKLIIVKYSGGSKKDKFKAVIGKGMTFDTGGLNLKPTGHIETMRCDMSGAAAVVGVLKNIVALQPKKNIILAVGMAENAIGSESYKPGDVLRGYSGKTVEIGNTDAEGRLVLADAIAYVVKNYQPDEIIDIATLTGACVVALGHDYTGLVSSNDAMARNLVKISNSTDDRVWRLPNYPEIKDHIKSQIADIKNIGIYKGAAGACTAAEFLRQFTGGTKWAHLDIAGTAFSERDRLYYGYGATGAGVRLLTEYLRAEQ